MSIDERIEALIKRNSHQLLRTRELTIQCEIQRAQIEVLVAQALAQLKKTSAVGRTCSGIQRSQGEVAP